MFPAAFEYHKPDTVAQALDLLTQFGDDAKLMAGGHSLIPAMKLRMSQPQHLIDLGNIAALKGIKVAEKYLTVGAATTHWEVESSRVAKAVLPLLTEVAGVIADPQVRNRGTMGGSLANADPTADWPASTIALEAELLCRSIEGERVVKATDWFQGPFTTALQENEVLCEIRFPLLPARTAATYLRLLHPASRFAVVGVAAIISVAEDSRCSDVRIGITGVGSHAVRAAAVEAELRDKHIDSELIAKASKAADQGCDIDGDMHFSRDDKRDLCRAYVRRALNSALGRANRGEFQGSHGSGNG